jgi:serine/threonine protein kinase
MTDTEPGSPLAPHDPEGIGPYRLLRRLGSGAMGRVYLAVDKDDPDAEPVAVKLIHGHLADQPLFRQRFAHELAAMRAVRDPHSARLLAADSDASQPWLASTFVPGPGIDAAVAARGPLPAAEVAAVGIGIARGLTAIHAARIVHRDLKPANVLLGRDGPVIIDFGIARAADATYLTATGLQVGTFEFMSPEQASGQYVGPPSDVFALGSVLFFAATGHSPFTANSAPAIAQLIVSAPPAADADSIPAALREVVLGCLEKDPARRPGLPELIERLTAVIAADAAGPAPSAGGTPDPPPGSPATEFALERVVQASPPPSAPSTASRHRRVVLASAVIAAAAAAAVTATLLVGNGGAKTGASSVTVGDVSPSTTESASAARSGQVAVRSRSPRTSTSASSPSVVHSSAVPGPPLVPTDPIGPVVTTVITLIASPTHPAQASTPATTYDETLGVGCSNAAHGTVDEYQYTASHPWTGATAASWSVSGCKNALAYTTTTPASSPTEWYNDYVWTFSHVPSGADCTFHVYVADSSYSEHTASYFWYDGAHPAADSADDDTFTVNQPLLHGSWYSYGPEVFRSGEASLEFTDRRVGSTGTMTASVVRLTCT